MLKTAAYSLTRAQLFERQKSSLLDLIRRRGCISRRDAARELGLRPSSVSFHVSELIERGVLREVSVDRGNVGRPAILLDFRGASLLEVGILVELHRVCGAVADLRGEVLCTAEAQLPPDSDGARVIATAASLVDSLVEKVDRDRVLGVGATVPGFVDRRGGQWEECGLMPHCRQVPLGSELSRHTALPVFIENDTRARALAEKWFATHRDFEDLLFVEVGEGVSAALLANGRIRRGASETAGELGHISIDPNGERCYCGGRGCLELHVTQDALFDTMRRQMDGQVSSVLPRLLTQTRGELTMAVLREALDAADKVALDAMEEFCVPLGVGLANAINLLNPSHVTVGGMLAGLGDHLLQPLLREIRARAFSRAVQAVTVTISELVERPPALAGAALVLEDCFAASGTGNDAARDKKPRGLSGRATVRKPRGSSLQEALK